MKSLDPRAIVGMVLVAVVAAAAAWFLLRPERPTLTQVVTDEKASIPSSSHLDDVDADEGVQENTDAGIRELQVMGMGDDAPIERRPGLPEVVMPDDAPHTDRCRLIAGWAQRNVPHYTILDNIRDGSMRFTEDDRACLAAAEDVPPIVVRFADRYKKSQHDLR